MEYTLKLKKVAVLFTLATNIYSQYAINRNIRYLKCTVAGCKGRAKLQNECINVTVAHTHERQPTEVETLQGIRKLREACCINFSNNFKADIRGRDKKCSI